LETKIEKILHPFLSKQKQRFFDGNVFCIFCGSEKKGFDDPKHGKKILECECERHFQMLRIFLNANSFWLSGAATIPAEVNSFGGDKQRQNHHKKFVIKAKVEFEKMREMKERAEQKGVIPFV
jgi:hypothetical protein